MYFKIIFVCAVILCLVSVWAKNPLYEDDKVVDQAPQSFQHSNYVRSIHRERREVENLEPEKAKADTENDDKQVTSPQNSKLEHHRQRRCGGRRRNRQNNNSNNRQ